MNEIVLLASAARENSSSCSSLSTSVIVRSLSFLFLSYQHEVEHLFLGLMTIPVSPSVKSLSLSPTSPLRCPSPHDDSQQFVMCFVHHLFVNYMHSHVVFAPCGLLSTLWKVFFVKPNFNFNVVSFLKVEGNEWVVLYVSYWKMSMLCLMNIFFCITYKPLCFWICNSFVLINWISCKW